MSDFRPVFDTQDGLLPPKLNEQYEQNLPKVFIGTFSHQVVTALSQDPASKLVARTRSLNGWENYYRWQDESNDFLYGMLLVGAPGTVAMLENVWALGVKHVIMFGTAGMLEQTNAEIFIPQAALRDEGTSQHYSDDTTGIIKADSDSMTSLQQFFSQEDVAYETVVTWTTDAIYRETPARIATAKAAGATVVEMEMAAALAWARFRNIKFYGFMHRADSLADNEWNGDTYVTFLHKLKMFNLAKKFAQNLEEAHER
jgi:uridine phosphorylase